MIPTQPDFPSLNIAAAAQVVAYELRMAACTGAQPSRGGERPPVGADEMERFYAHLEEVLVQIEFLNPAAPRQLMRRLRRMYNRLHPDDNEMNILRGILTAVQKQLPR